MTWDSQEGSDTQVLVWSIPSLPLAHPTALLCLLPPPPSWTKWAERHGTSSALHTSHLSKEGDFGARAFCLCRDLKGVVAILSFRVADDVLLLNPLLRGRLVLGCRQS